MYLYKRRIDKLIAKLNVALSKNVLSTRELASITGSIISMNAVYGQMCHALSRRCQISIAAAANWESDIKIDKYYEAELRFWQSNVESLNKKDCFIASNYVCKIFSDASSSCALKECCDNIPMCHRLFTEEEKALSSTHRELLAIEYSLECFLPFIKNSKVKWYRSVV